MTLTRVGIVPSSADISVNCFVYVFSLLLRLLFSFHLVRYGIDHMEITLSMFSPCKLQDNIFTLFFPFLQM